MYDERWESSGIFEWRWMDIYGCMDWWEQYDCALPLIPPEMIDDEENILERTIIHIGT
jgi:hypothetical protein